MNNQKLRFPVDYVGITCGYSSSHMAIDLCWHNTPSEPIFACADGKVSRIWVDESFGGGNTLTIEHDNGYRSDFKHLEKSLVKVGERVTQGQQVAIMGNTGWASKGTHLHYNCYKNGVRVNPLDHTYLYPGQTVADEDKNSVMYYTELPFKVGDYVYATEELKLYTTIQYSENKYTAQKGEKLYVKSILDNNVALANPVTKEYYPSAWTKELDKLTKEEPQDDYKGLYEKELLVNKDLQVQIKMLEEKINKAINDLK